jgi:methanogenic corrinoid protein MtbC1
MNFSGFNIAAVERDLGLSKDVLRIWERRYGFPAPLRDANGERIYPPDQVERLRTIKRLMDLGHRPGKLIATPLEELAGLSPRHQRPVQVAANAEAGDLGGLLELIRNRDSAGFQQTMQQRLVRQGLQRFVQDTVAPLTRLVGEGWEQGRLQVFEEHLYTELTKRLLRQAIASLPVTAKRPRVLLTSLPEEPHALGLLMVEALFTLEGAECVPLGTQMPLLEIVRAAEAHHADIVALSFSAAFPARQISGMLGQLRLILPERVAIWAGGGGVQRLAGQKGVLLVPTLKEALAALADWRSALPSDSA